MRPQFRACYSEGLKTDPQMDGCAVLRAKVASDGAVASSEVFVFDGLTREVADCLAAALGTAKFSAPGGGGSMLMVPVTFVRQR